MVDMTTSVKGYVNNLPVDPYISIIAPKNQSYGRNLFESTGLGPITLTAFGRLGPDNEKANIGGVQKDIVASPIEFYYTDLVFLKSQYERALISLYRNLAEMPGKHAEVKEAIGLVKEIAKRRGVNVNEDNAKAIYRQEITAEILEVGSKYFGIGQCNGQCQTLVDYYLNPTNSNYQNMITIGKRLRKNDYNTYSKYTRTISDLCEGLADRIYSDVARI